MENVRWGSWEVQKIKGSFPWAAVCFLMLSLLLKSSCAGWQGFLGMRWLLGYPDICNALTPGLLDHPEDGNVSSLRF